jgi:hypothetical protein
MWERFKRISDEQWAMIEFAVLGGALLVMEQLLLPYPDVTKSRLEVGTVLIFSNLWFLLYSVASSHKEGLEGK